MRASSLRRSTRLTSSAIRAALAGSGCNSRANTSRISGTVRAGIFPPEPILLQNQEPQRQQRKRHVVMPTHPTPHLVVTQAYLALARLENLFDSVPVTVGLDHSGQRHVAGVRQRVPDLRFLGDRADRSEEHTSELQS